MIASILKRDIFFVNLNSFKSETDFADVLNKIPDRKKALIVIEDIDAHGVDVNRAEEKEVLKSRVAREGINLSALLNTLDGLLSPGDLVTIATTNHIDKLDPALVRSGRFDLKLEISECGIDEFRKMALFFGEDPDCYTLDKFIDVPGATLRGLLLEGGVAAVIEHQKTLIHGEENVDPHCLDIIG